MSKQTRVKCSIYDLRPTEVEGFDSLAELALDMRWSWNHATDQVWRRLDPELWEITHNPWVVLQTVSRDEIERVDQSALTGESKDSDKTPGDVLSSGSVVRRGEGNAVDDCGESMAAPIAIADSDREPGPWRQACRSSR